MSKKIGSLIRSLNKFLSPEVALYFYKSTICPFMKYYCHVCVGAPNCYTEFLDKLQNCQNGTSSSHSYYSGRCSNECFNWFHFLVLKAGLLVIMIDYMIFLSLPRCCKDVCVNRFFPCTARFWNSLPIEHFLLTYDLNNKRKLYGPFLWMEFN